MQDSGTTAGLRGIDSVDGTIAWASGTGGTILKTTDGGAHWQKCAIPDADRDGATLDFRGVQAWDATTAIVMASGPGDKSRLYKTTDGCKSWKLVFRNPDRGRLLGRQFPAQNVLIGNTGLLLGDPVKGRFASLPDARSRRNLDIAIQTILGLRLRKPMQASFAASNSSNSQLFGPILATSVERRQVRAS